MGNSSKCVHLVKFSIFALFVFFCLVLCSTVNYTTALPPFLSQSSLPLLCSACITGGPSRSERSHRGCVHSNWYRTEGEYWRDTAGDSLPKELNFLLPPWSWRVLLTPVTTPTGRSSPEVTKQGLNSGNSCNCITFQVLKTFLLLPKFFWKKSPSNVE